MNQNERGIYYNGRNIILRQQILISDIRVKNETIEIARSTILEEFKKQFPNVVTAELWWSYVRDYPYDGHDAIIGFFEWKEKHMLTHAYSEPEFIGQEDHLFTLSMDFAIEQL